MSSVRLPWLRVLLLPPVVALGCNAIFGISGGEPSGSAGAASTSGTSSSGTTTTATTSTTGTTTTSTTTTTGTCPAAKIPACSNTPCDPVILAQNEKFTLGIAVVGDYVVWAAGYGTQGGGLPSGHIRAIKYDGTESTQFGDGSDSVAIVADADNLYYTDWTDNNIRLVPLGIAQPSSLVVGTTTNAQSYFADIAVHARNLYVPTQQAAGIWWVEPKAGGGWNSPVMISTRDESIEYAGIAADADFVYWADVGGVRRATAAKATVTPETFAADDMHPRDVTLDATRVYWVSDEGHVRSRRKADKGGLITYQMGDSDHPRGILVDGEHLYWSTFAGRIWRARLDGTTARQLVAQGPANAYKLAADCGAIYWTHFEPFTADTGTVYKVKRPP